MKTTVEARSASSATKPSASLSAASATIATHGPERSGVKREIAQDGADVERHMRAVHDDGQASRPDFDVKALHAPGETRGEARVAVEKRRADRLAGARAHPLAAKLAENGGCEREIDLFDRGRGVDARAFHPRAEFVGSGLQDAPGFVIRRSSVVTSTAPGLRIPTFSPRDRRARLAQNLRVLERDVGDDGDFAVDDVGRIEPAAQAHFDHRPLDGRFAEDEKGGGGEKVEPGCIGRGRAGLARCLIGVERAVQGSAQESARRHRVPER